MVEENLNTLPTPGLCHSSYFATTVAGTAAPGGGNGAIADDAEAGAAPGADEFNATDLLSSSGLVTSSEEFYPTVAINALVGDPGRIGRMRRSRASVQALRFGAQFGHSSRVLAPCVSWTASGPGLGALVLCTAACWGAAHWAHTGPAVLTLGDPRCGCCGTPRCQASMTGWWRH